MKVLYLAWSASNKTRAGHLHWIPKSLLEYRGAVEFTVAVLRTCSLRSALPILNPKAYLRGFDFQDFQMAVTEAQVISEEAAKREISQVVIYEGAMFELQVATQLARLNPQMSIIVNLFAAQKWADYLRSADESTLASLRMRFNQESNLFLTAETDGLSNVIAEKLGWKPKVFPVFTTLDYQLERGKSLSSLDISETTRDKICISVGSEHHFEFLIELLSRLRGRVDMRSVRLILQARGGFKRCHSRKLRKLGINSNQVLRGNLSPEDYASTLSSSILILFTYDSKKYLLKSSGRVQDALLLGCVPVVSSGTALPSQIWQAGNESIHTYQDCSASSAFKEIIEVLSSSKRNLHAIRVSEFTEWLLEIAAESKSPTGVMIDSWRKTAYMPKNNFSDRRNFRFRISSELVRLGLLRP